MLASDAAVRNFRPEPAPDTTWPRPCSTAAGRHITAYLRARLRWLRTDPMRTCPRPHWLAEQLDQGCDFLRAEA
jgi:hypothetical protein